MYYYYNTYSQKIQGYKVFLITNPYKLFRICSWISSKDQLQYQTKRAMWWHFYRLLSWLIYKTPGTWSIYLTNKRKYTYLKHSLSFLRQQQQMQQLHITSTAITIPATAPPLTPSVFCNNNRSWKALFRHPEVDVILTQCWFFHPYHDCDAALLHNLICITAMSIDLFENITSHDKFVLVETRNIPNFLSRQLIFVATTADLTYYICFMYLVGLSLRW